MRRRFSWAVLGTSGVLAVIVGTMMVGSDDGKPEKAAGPKIIVPLAEDAVVDLPTTTATRPSTVFIDVPPVAVTSETAIPQPPQEQEPVVPAPKKAPPPLPSPSSKPVLPVPTVKVPPVMPKPDGSQSFWKLYPGYMNYYGPGGGYYGGYGYGYGGPGPYGYPQGGNWGR